jgi:hypothetical protein
MAYHSADRRASIIPGVRQVNISRGVEYPTPVTNPRVTLPTLNKLASARFQVPAMPGQGVGCSDLGCNGPVQGLGIDFGIDVGEIAGQVGNQVVNSVWPNIEAKINELAPRLVNTAVDQVKTRVPEMATSAINSPEVQAEAGKLIAKYETDYKTKYRPLLYFVFIAGSLWTAAAAFDLYDRYKKMR